MRVLDPEGTAVMHMISVPIKRAPQGACLLFPPREDAATCEAESEPFPVAGSTDALTLRF